MIALGDALRNGKSYATAGRSSSAQRSRARAKRSPFVPLPKAVLNDERLSDVAVRVYAIMLDASRDGTCKISVKRIGERLGRGRAKYAAIRAIDQLVCSGYLSVAPRTRGQAAVYRLSESGCLQTTTPAPEGNEQGPRTEAEIETFNSAFAGLKSRLGVA